MHIPDGMLDTKTWVAAAAGSAGLVGYAVRTVRRTLSEERVVLMSLVAALVFALQLLNFPVAGGTSGHFTGGAAAAILLGPWPAVLVMTTVLVVQAFVFADGGVTALGANVLDMAVVAPLVGWAVYRLAAGAAPGPARRSIAAFGAAWTACVAAALSAGLLLWAAGRAPLLLVTAAMGFWHALIGIGEGIITAGLVAYVAAVRPNLIGAQQERPAREWRGVALGLGAAALLSAGLSAFASRAPDGLEYVYFDWRLGEAFETFEVLPAPAPGYLLPGVHNETLAGVLAGIAGAIVTGALLYALGSAVRRQKRDGASE